MLIIGHRGASALAPENTLSAFRTAIRAGADLIEMDLRLSRDGEVVVFHDRVLDRTTDGSGPVAEKSLAELKQLDAGRRFSPEFRGERIPALREVLELAASGRTGLYLELKIDRGAEEIRPELVARTLEVLAGQSFPGRLILASFDPVAVRLVRRLEPGIPTGLIFREEAVWDQLPSGGLDGIDVLSARWNTVTAARVADGRRAGKEVWGWTVDRPEELTRVKAAGVDGAASNNPAWLRSQLERTG